MMTTFKATLKWATDLSCCSTPNFKRDCGRSKDEKGDDKNLLIGFRPKAVERVVDEPNEHIRVR
jgi:hypothetical protein